ncbi:MAG: hypothetical protein LBS07_03200 [Prevotellaceae bacterium]|jgi:hypothetical protein|nr:hypothetical protein [Prevotellaceae bacterium]
MRRKLILMSGAVIAFGLASISCKNNEPDDKSDSGIITKIEGTVANGGSYDVDTVKVMHNSEEATIVLASSKWDNGKFTLNLPATLPDSYVSSLENEEGVTISDKAAKTYLLSVLQLYKNGKYKGTVSQAAKAGASTAKIQYFYTDRDVVLSGTTIGGSEKITYNANFKKGWNTVYYILEDTNTDGKVDKASYATQKPKDMTFEWTVSISSQN